MDLYSESDSDSSSTTTTTVSISSSEDYYAPKICPVCKNTVPPGSDYIHREDVVYHSICLYRISCKHIRAVFDVGNLIKNITFEYGGRMYCDMPCAAKRTNTPYNLFPHCLKCKEVLLYNSDVRVFKDKIFHDKCMKCTICNLHIVSGENIIVFDDGNIQHRHKMPCSTKNKRTVIQPYQKRILRQFYATNKHPTNAELEIISKYVNVSINVCKIWFQNQRARVG